MTRHLRIWAAAMLVGTSGSSLSAWQDDDGLDPKADGIVQEASDYLRNLNSFELTITVEMQLQMEGMRQQVTSTHRMAMERPNRLSIVLAEGFMANSIVCDGDTLYTLLGVMDDQYTADDAPETLGGIADHIQNLAMGDMTDATVFGAMLVAGNPHEWILDGVTTLEYADRQDVDGTSCHRLRMSQPDGDWQLWVQVGEQPVPRKLVIDLREMYREMWFDGSQDITAELTVRFDHWRANIDMPADRFAFVAPEGAVRVDSFFDDMFIDDGVEAHPLVGRPAPGFRLDLLDGGEVALREHRDREIVILDFWATWCLPCAEALPILADVAREYRDRGVVLYAVNENEDPETIRAFLKTRQLDLVVPLDRHGRVGDLYGVTGIPQTVLINKAGTVQVVHAGFGSGLKEQLRGELDALLTGVNLADLAPAVAPAVGNFADLDEVWPTVADYTMHEYHQQDLARSREALIEGYTRHGNRDDAWDAPAIEFIEMCIQAFNLIPGAPTMTELQEAGRPLIELGCDDPVVLYGYGYAFDRQNHNSNGEEYLRAAVEGLQRSAYPPEQLAAAASRFARYLEASRRHDEARHFHQIAADALLEASRTAPGDWFAQRHLASLLSLHAGSFLPQDIAEALIDRLTALEGLNPCTLHTVIGAYHIGRGWDKRGDGFADTVTEDGWSSFRVHMEVGRDHLEQAYRLDPTRPEAPANMIRVAMAGHAREGEDELFWFTRAVKAQIDWFPAYDFIRWSLRPRWGGDYDAMHQFGLACMRSGRYDTLVPFQLVRVLLDIADDAEGSRDFWVMRDVQPAADEVLTRLADRPEHVDRVAYYRTLAAGFAWATKRYDAARGRVRAANSVLDADALADMKMVSRRILDDVTVFTSPVAARVAEADEAFEWDRPGEAFELYEAALADASDPAVAAVVQDRLATADMYRLFQAGDWAALSFQRELPGWRVRRGLWHASVPGLIKGGPGGLMLVCQAPIGSRFELRGRIDMSHLAFNKDNNMGIAFRYREQLDSSEWNVFLIYNQQKRCWIGHKFARTAGDSAPLAGRVGKSFDFHLQVWENHAALRLNGKPVFAGPLTGYDNGSPGALLGLTGWYSRSGYGGFQDLQVRRLAEPPEVIAELLEGGWR